MQNLNPITEAPTYDELVEKLAAAEMTLARMRKWGHHVADEFVDAPCQPGAEGVQEWARKEWDALSELPLDTSTVIQAIAAAKAPLEARIVELTKLRIV
jgi:hypothetical protein